MERKEFNETHSVGQVINGEIARQSQDPKPEEVDLRFFSSIFYSDTYNGKSAPLDG